MAGTVNIERIQEAHQYRIELILLGMTLARDGDRQRLLERVPPEKIANATISRAIQAIHENDPEMLFDSLGDLGVYRDGSALNSLTERHRRLREDARVRELVAMLLTSNYLDTRESTIARVRDTLHLLESGRLPSESASGDHTLGCGDADEGDG